MKAVRSFAIALALCSPAALVAPAHAQRGDAMMFVAKAGASDLYEIQSSQIAVRRARDPRVRSFASMLVRDHRRTTVQVTAAARAAGLRPRPPMLEPRQRMMINQLNRAPARSFDQVYLSQQIPAHQEALGLHRNYSRSGSVATLRRVATGAVPVVEAHLAEARRLQR
jgi:putative membrane protein